MTKAVEKLEPVPSGGALQTQMPQVTSMIERALTDPNVSVEKMERLFALQKDVMQEQSKIDYADAMSRFQSRKEVIAHNQKGSGPGGASYTYSDYPMMVAAVTPWLKDCGLSFTHRQEPVIENGQVVMVMVFCIISHSSGHSREFSYPAIPDNKLREKLSPSQLIQLAITYAKRQTLAMGLGLATAEDTRDDDSLIRVERVSEEQAANIRALIEETGADEKKFLTWIKVDSIERIPAAGYQMAVKALEAKRKAK